MTDTVTAEEFAAATRTKVTALEDRVRAGDTAVTAAVLAEARADADHAALLLDAARAADARRSREGRQQAYSAAVDAVVHVDQGEHVERITDAYSAALGALEKLWAAALDRDGETRQAIAACVDARDTARQHRETAALRDAGMAVVGSDGATVRKDAVVTRLRTVRPTDLVALVLTDLVDRVAAAAETAARASGFGHWDTGWPPAIRHELGVYARTALAQFPTLHTDSDTPDAA